MWVLLLLLHDQSTSVTTWSEYFCYYMIRVLLLLHDVSPSHPQPLTLLLEAPMVQQNEQILRRLSGFRRGQKKMWFSVPQMSSPQSVVALSQEPSGSQALTGPSSSSISASQRGEKYLRQNPGAAGGKRAGRGEQETYKISFAHNFTGNCLLQKLLPSIWVWHLVRICLYSWYKTQSLQMWHCSEIQGLVFRQCIILISQQILFWVGSQMKHISLHIY